MASRQFEGESHFDAFEIVFLISAGAILSAAFVLSVASSSLTEALSKLGTIARRVYVCIHAERQGGHKTDSIQRHAMEKLEQLQQKRMQYAWTGALWMLNLILVLAVQAILTRSTSWRSRKQDVLVCVCVPIVMVVSCSYGGWSSRAVHGCHGGIMLFTVLWVQLSEDSLVMMATSAFFITAVRLAMLSTCLGSTPVTFWYLICALADCAKVASADSDMSSVFVPDGIDVRKTVYLFEAFACFFAITFAAWMRSRVLRDFREEISCRVHDIENSACHSLLEHSCDVILRLDGDRKISDDSAAFRAMLMLDQSIAGKDLQQFMPYDDDKERFQNRFLLAYRNTKSKVSCMNVHMRDSTGTILCVEVMGVAFTDLDDMPSYMLGLREYSDAFPGALRDVPRLRDESCSRIRVREPTRLGTPAVSAPNTIGNVSPSDLSRMDDESSNCSSSDAGLAVQRLAVPGRKATSETGRFVSLLSTMASWNVDVSKRPCCSYHACLFHVRRAVDAIAHSPCQVGFHDEASAQCAACGLLGSLSDEGACRSCGHQQCQLAL
eukprot:TRINITY_DN4023_c0_g2_i1.p1 TRINITY_DN4023_c0_g2~~TRINITY_DN4023_c0_g2_i1.p1  ORF type:complete len:551 (-),score=56.56 TRINITY_DN4023_c0_g2_i1:172-1824(-)